MAEREKSAVVQRGVYDSLPKVRAAYADGWGDIKRHLPDSYNPHWTKFLRGYFRGQLLLKAGKRDKAMRLYEGLEKRTGYLEFEKQNQEWLAAIDLAVRGNNRRDAEPAFYVNSPVKQGWTPLV